MHKYAKLILKTKSRMTDQVYTYRIPAGMDIKKGQRVLVPFGRGNKKVLGIVVAFTDEVDEEISYKEIDSPVEANPILSEELIDLAFFMADEYLSDLSSAINSLLPPGDVLKITELYRAKDLDGALGDFLSTARSYEEIKEAYPNINRSKLKLCIDKGKIETRISLTRDASIKKIRMLRLVLDPKLAKERVRSSAYKQLVIIDHLANCHNMEDKQKNTLRATESSLSSVKSLEEKGIVEIYDEEVYRQVLKKDFKAYHSHQLSEDQQAVYDQILTSQSDTFLLKGVTGSGKTEIYLQLVQQVIEAGKQAIILVPEISLTPQTINRFVGRFGDRVAVLHSKLSVSERFDQWRMIKEGLYDIVVGTRSAIFAPLDDIGIIVIDEEHELSYINEKNPKYDAIDIARFRADYHKCNLILGTATPRVESYYRALKGDYRLLELNKRVCDKGLPEVYKIDMRNELKQGNFSMYARDLKEAIEEKLIEGKQSILFLNKRGHTSYVFCRKCGYVQTCSACDASMTYHKDKDMSLCHLCGRTERKPLICPACGSNAIKEFGAGTQKLEEATREEFPTAKVARMDADTMSKKSSYERVYDQMERGEIDILIGTQMISKGFDFKNVEVVGIVSADLSLHVPDFRSAEKTFQLITQVAGRAGRGDGPGSVYIQTYEPDHYAIVASQKHDYEAFYDQEIRLREFYHYPPFYDMILVRVSHVNRAKALGRAFEIKDLVHGKTRKLDVEIIGPNPAVIDRINNYFRFNIVFKTKNSIEELKKAIDLQVIKNPEFLGQGYKYYIMINPNSI